MQKFFVSPRAEAFPAPLVFARTECWISSQRRLCRRRLRLLFMRVAELRGGALLMALLLLDGSRVSAQRSRFEHVQS